MDFILGLLTAVVFFILLGFVYLMGYKRGNTKPSASVDDEMIQKQERLKKDFQQVMNYDLNTALQRKRVD